MKKLSARDIKELYLRFFESKGHKRIPSAPLIPENDPTVLFTTAGMHPLVPFLMGQPHPLGKRLCDVQKCLRTQDIDEVGDATHTTMFEMLGNWSLGDYFKKEAISWSYEFLTSPEWLGLDKSRLAFTCFAGDKDAPKDDEAANVWLSLGVPAERIAFLPKKSNWWGPAGTTGPCGPDTEMFYWKLNDKPAPAVFDPEDNNWVEIWNDVFMQYNKTAEGAFELLAQKNVDTGMGTERVAMALQGQEDIFKTDAFKPIMDEIEQLSGQKPVGANLKSFRIIADHLRAATFILGDERGVVPSNVDQGYILRRYIRRAIRHGALLGIHNDYCGKIAEVIIKTRGEEWPLLKEKQGFILAELAKEEQRFRQTLERGLKQFEKVIAEKPKHIDGVTAFDLFQSYGFPLEMTEELASEHGIKVDVDGFAKEYEKHKELSRVGAEKKFKGGLADSGETTTRLHTATHLLNEALRKVISKEIVQKGSNITPERLRFDFNFSRKVTPEEIKKVEDEVNRVIAASMPVTRMEMTPDEAKKMGAQAEFGMRYPEKVSVYKVGDYSIEICMGPHVQNTKELGHFKIIKEEASAAGVRRIKAVVE